MTDIGIALGLGNLRALRKQLSADQLAGWLDQGVVSATSFLVLLMLARWASVEHVGYYAIGISIIALAIAVQDSLVTRPYAIQVFRPPLGAQAHAFGALAFGILLSGVVALSLAATAAFLGHGSGLATLFLALAAIMPFVLGREFARRYSFANLRMREALLLDAAACAMLVLGLVLAHGFKPLTAATAMAVLGVASGTSLVAWCLIKRRSFANRAGAVTSTVRQSWGIGKWLLTSQVALQIQGYAAHWIALIVAGAAATGLYSACLSVVALANPFLFGFFNLLTPKYVRVYRHGGYRVLRRQAAVDTLILAVVMGAFTAFVASFGAVLMTYLFPGEAYSGGTGILTILSLSAAVGALGGPATVALATLERGRAQAAVSLAACVLGSALVWVLMVEWGLEAAAAGILLTDCVSSLARWIIFLHAGAREGASAAPGECQREPA
jgi:O-antigen/teichoic acid export membrane protein